MKKMGLVTHATVLSSVHDEFNTKYNFQANVQATVADVDEFAAATSIAVPDRR